MFHKTDRQLNREQIKAHLKSAVMDLTPNVLDKIDLSVPQMAAEELHEDAGRAVSSITVMRKRMRVVAALAAACLCMRTWVKELNSALHGRGGGKPGFVQGSAAAKWDEIVAFMSK